MNNLKNNIVTLRSQEKYFVLDETMLEYDTFYLILNVNNEKDVKIVLEKIQDGKTILEDVEDLEKIKILKEKFKTSLSSI